MPEGTPMPDQPLSRAELAQALHAGLRRSSSTLLIAGIVLIALGSIAIVLPEIATLVVTGFVSWVLVLSAAVHLYLAWRVHGAWRVAGAMLAGLISLAAGLAMLANPALAAAALTWLLAAYLVAGGVVKAVAACQLRPVPGWVWTLVSALVSLVLGLLILSGWPGTAAWMIGLLVGIDLLLAGWALIALRAAVNH